METAYRTAYVYVRETFAGHLRETDSGYSFLYDEKYLEDPNSTNVNFITKSTIPKPIMISKPKQPTQIEKVLNMSLYKYDKAQDF